VFSGASLAKTIFSGSQLRQSLWVKAKAQGAAFEKSELCYADLSYADLTSASCKGADFTGANLHAVVEIHTDWTDGLFEKAKTTDEKRLRAETWRPPPLEAATKT
jgi:uncharacterized protein YjbI with pentapeptide repeats